MITLPTQEQIKNLSMPKLFELLNVNQKGGLSLDEVKYRHRQFGLNEILEKRKNYLLLFLKKFWGPSAWMIEAIAILSLFLHKQSDFYVSSGLLLVNAVIGFFQERRAEM